jgi:hypothetical protein
MSKSINSNIGVSRIRQMLADDFNQRVSVFSLHGFDDPSMVSFYLL